MPGRISFLLMALLSVPISAQSSTGSSTVPTFGSFANGTNLSSSALGAQNSNADSSIKIPEMSPSKSSNNRQTSTTTFPDIQNTPSNISIAITNNSDRVGSTSPPALGSISNFQSFKNGTDDATLPPSSTKFDGSPATFSNSSFQMTMVTPAAPSQSAFPITSSSSSTSAPFPNPTPRTTSNFENSTVSTSIATGSSISKLTDSSGHAAPIGSFYNTTKQAETSSTMLQFNYSAVTIPISLPSDVTLVTAPFRISSMVPNTVVIPFELPPSVSHITVTVTQSVAASTASSFGTGGNAQPTQVSSSANSVLRAVGAWIGCLIMGTWDWF